MDRETSEDLKQIKSNFTLMKRGLSFSFVFFFLFILLFALGQRFFAEALLFASLIFLSWCLHPVYKKQEAGRITAFIDAYSDLNKSIFWETIFLIFVVAIFGVLIPFWTLFKPEEQISLFSTILLIISASAQAIIALPILKDLARHEKELKKASII
jgi:carbon starvation protein CstA